MICEDLKEYFIFMVKYNRVLTTKHERSEFTHRIFSDMLVDVSVHPAIKKRLAPFVSRHMEGSHGH